MPIKYRQNLPLIVGLSLPVLMILFIAAAIYIPALFANPTTDFVYAIGDGTYYRFDGINGEYVIQSGKIVRNPPVYPEDYPRPERDIPSQLYYHDVEEDKSRQISLQEAQQLTLDPGPVSSEGFEVVRGSRGGGDFFPFFIGGRYDYNTVYLIGHNTSIKMNVLGVSPNTYADFRFVGWVVE